MVILCIKGVKVFVYIVLYHVTYSVHLTRLCKYTAGLYNGSNTLFLTISTPWEAYTPIAATTIIPVAATK